jgi:hypothetical protein
VRPEGLGKLRKRNPSPHWAWNPRPYGFWHRALTTTLRDLATGWRWTVSSIALPLHLRLNSPRCPSDVRQSMELSTAREATSSETTRWFPSISWNPKVHYHIHNSSPLVPILSQTNPVNTTQSYISKINSNIILPLTFWSS